MTVFLREHSEPSYKQRTLFNVAKSDITIAFAVDPTTAGEQLTKRAATEGKYVHIDLTTCDTSAAAREIRSLIAAKLGDRPCNILNIAGNELHVLSQYGWGQERVNRYLFEVFCELKGKWGFSPRKGFRSGGQTGVELAGIVMAYSLGIDIVATYPKGFLQEGSDGADFTEPRESVQCKIQDMVDLLSA